MTSSTTTSSTTTSSTTTTPAASADPQPAVPYAPRRLSLLQPTGHLTLGNYLGAIRGMAGRTEGATCFYGICDLHALTVPHDPGRLRRLVEEMQALLLACGVDPERATLFVQSEVPAHTELSYLMECTVHTGELNRMIQFKEKGRGRAHTRASLYTYPALMAADILLYRASEVPVGDDQRQHVELARDLAVRFNREYGETFTVPRLVTPPAGARVMDLQDPRTKMGKSSESGAGVVYLLDDPDSVARKISRAVTDSDTGPGAVRHDRERKPGVSNLLEIIAGCEGVPVAEATAGIASYGALKARATEAVLAVLEPVQERYAALAAEPDRVRAVYDAGATRARAETREVLTAARAAIGLS